MSRADLSDPEIKQAYDDIKASNSQTNFILLGYAPKSDTKLKVAETGTGGLQEVFDSLTNAGKVQFALVAFDVNKTKKFAYISWCGESVTGIKKGLFNNHANDVALFFKGFHVQINARSEADIDEKKIMERLKKASGASYDSGQKVQGGNELVPNSVSQGKQQASQSNVQRGGSDKSDYNKKDESSEYWNKQREEEENDKKKQQEQKQQNLPRNQYNKSNEREQFWAQQKQDEPAKTQPGRPAPTGSAPGGKSKFENQNQQSNPPPRNAPPPKNQPPQHQAPKPPPAPEPVEEVPPQEEAPPAPEEPQQSYEEPQQAEEPQQTYEEPEQTTEEPQQTYEEPQQTYEEPQQTYEEPQQTFDEPQGGAGQCKALYDYTGENDGDLAFKEGDLINVIDKSDPSGWWEGEVGGVRGFFPSNFVEEI